MRRPHFRKSFRLSRFYWVLSGIAVLCLTSLAANAQTPVVVQPGAPGQPTRSLPSDTRAKLPPVSRTDVGFMQGMIMHHAQAVEMTALISGRSESKELKLLGARISHSQAEEMRFMERWLLARGEKTAMEMSKTGGVDHSHHNMDHSPMLMPGMLSAEQMAALAKARGRDFDRLFLKGMIQHHQGALAMVTELFDQAGGGQEADLFNFATEVDSGQRAEIRTMQEMLTKL